ncbi:hypothetical protein V5F44_20640, partial [Xanthobacter sp. V2C-8]|uniref:hypothetical protein n=1 Tax=Xanthobacter albus TaxID=3119929 RepID=UPI0037275045
MRWRPAHDNHSIERACVTFQLSEKVPSKPWQTLINRAAIDLPSRDFNATSDDVEINLQLGDLQGIGSPIVFGADGLVLGGGLSSQEVGGKTFRRVSGPDTLEEVSLLRNRITYATSSYTRWSNYKDRASILLSPFLTPILSLVNASTIK